MSKGIKTLTGILRRIIFLHANKIIHRDINPANLLLDESHQVVKITNFGLAKHFPGSESTMTRCGSPYYQAFEQATDSYDFRIDIFSVGVVMLELCILSMIDVILDRTFMHSAMIGGCQLTLAQYIQ